MEIPAYQCSASGTNVNYTEQRLLFLPAGNEAQLTCNSTTYKNNFDTICLRLVTHSYVLRNYHVYSIVCNFLFSISPNGDDVDYGNTNFK